jgi:hypothetical protein
VKKYGVTYCALRDKNPQSKHPVEILVKAEDSSKTRRIFEKLGIGDVDVSSIESEIGRRMAETAQQPPDSVDEEQLLEQLLTRPKGKDETAPENPSAAKTEKSPPSEPTSKKQETGDKGMQNEKPSVREYIGRRRAERAEEDKAGVRMPVKDKDSDNLLSYLLNGRNASVKPERSNR